MSFAHRAKFLRKEESLSQRDLAEKLNLQSSLISQLENGKREPDIRVLYAYSQYFKVSIEFLLEINTDYASEIKELVSAYNALENECITEKEKAMLTAFRNLLPETQDFVLRTAQSLCDKKTLPKNSNV